jgi:ABC-2 type transport system ATP-binding protein
MAVHSGQAGEATPGVPAIQLTQLSKRFGERLAVQALDLSVQPGELFGFLGPNGAGKTTTIKLMVGLLQPTSGTAALCGHDVVSDALAARAVLGYVPDQAALYDRLSGREMLGFAGDLHRVPRDLQEQRIGPMLETFALADHGDELVQSYSRGMRQKLALCCALMHDPRVLFLDEPTVGLDPAGARQLKQVLRQLCDRGRTVFLSTHVLEVAEFLCDRVSIFQGGRILATDTPQGLRSGGDANLEASFLRLTGGGDEDVDGLLAVLEE